jgi:hypothetical protein
LELISNGPIGVTLWVRRSGYRKIARLLEQMAWVVNPERPLAKLTSTARAKPKSENQKSDAAHPGGAVALGRTGAARARPVTG